MQRYTAVCPGCGWESVAADMLAVVLVEAAEHLDQVHAAAVQAGTAPAFRVHTVQEFTASELLTEIASNVEPGPTPQPPPAYERPEPPQHTPRGGKPRRKG